MLLLSALMFSGCARFELTHTYYYPGDFYSTVKTLDFERQQQFLMSPPLFCVLLPFAFMFDTLALPFQLIRYAHFCDNKPLNELIRENNLEELKRRLDSGEDPDFIDIRYNDGRFSAPRPHRVPVPPIAEAFKLRNLEAFTLLLDHGADVPLTLFNSYAVNDALTVDYLDYYRLIFARGFPKEKTECFAALEVVSDCLNRNLCHPGFERVDIHKLYELTKLLLENGFPPNPKTAFSPPTNSIVNALDCVKKSELDDSTKRKFIELLQAYHAKTNAEFNASNAIPVLPDTSLGDIPDIFKPVVDILSRSHYKNHYRYSATYPGINSPVLVADLEQRRKTFIHHRETPTRWNQVGEPFDIPEHHRIVLTPKGLKIPSRIKGDIPKYNVLWEEWISLPTCEAYIERSAAAGCSYEECLTLNEIRRLGGIEVALSDSQYPIPKDKMELFYTAARSPFQPYCQRDMTSLQTSYNSYDVGRIEKIQKANKLLKDTGIKGKWYRFAYSSHRDLLHLAANKDHIVPYPDEIVVSLDRNLWILGHVSKKYTCIDYSEEYKGQFYWNCRTYVFNANRRKAFIHVLYGDEADMKQIDAIIKLVQETIL